MNQAILNWNYGWLIEHLIPATHLCLISVLLRFAFFLLLFVQWRDCCIYYMRLIVVVVAVVILA